jgi:hypothetical protein
MRLVALASISALTLAGCATATITEANPGTYTLGRGLVTYDAMNRAKQDCQAAGGLVRPIDDGGDPNQMSNYACVISSKEKSQ